MYLIQHKWSQQLAGRESRSWVGSVWSHPSCWSGLSLLFSHSLSFAYRALILAKLFSSLPFCRCYFNEWCVCMCVAHFHMVLAHLSASLWVYEHVYWMLISACLCVFCSSVLGQGAYLTRAGKRQTFFVSVVSPGLSLGLKLGSGLVVAKCAHTRSVLVFSACTELCSYPLHMCGCSCNSTETRHCGYITVTAGACVSGTQPDRCTERKHITG